MMRRVERAFVSFEEAGGYCWESAVSPGTDKEGSVVQLPQSNYVEHGAPGDGIAGLGEGVAAQKEEREYDAGSGRRRT